MWWERDECCDGGLIYELVTYVFLAGSITCLLFALHRIASALKLGARAKAYDSAGAQMTDEEREVLVRKIASHAIHYV